MDINLNTVTAFPVNSAASSTHLAETIEVFLAWFSHLVLCSCVWFSVWHSSDALTGRGEWRRLLKTACLPQRTRSEQLIASGGSNPIDKQIHHTFNKACMKKKQQKNTSSEHHRVRWCVSVCVCVGGGGGGGCDMLMIKSVFKK